VKTNPFHQEWVRPIQFQNLYFTLISAFTVTELLELMLLILLHLFLSVYFWALFLPREYWFREDLQGVSLLIADLRRVTYLYEKLSTDYPQYIISFSFVL
jgi:hypothetical protein